MAVKCIKCGSENVIPVWYFRSEQPPPDWAIESLKRHEEEEKRGELKVLRRHPADYEGLNFTHYCKNCDNCFEEKKPWWVRKTPMFPPGT